VTHAGSDQLPVSQVGVRHIAPNPRAFQRVLLAGLPLAECGDAPAKPAAPATYYEAWFEISVETFVAGLRSRFGPPRPTGAVLRAWKRAPGPLALALARDDALAFSDLEGGYLHPERFSRTFKSTLARYRKKLGDGAPPEIRLLICAIDTPPCYRRIASRSRPSASGSGTPASPSR
jgi:hypothetical protein